MKTTEKNQFETQGIQKLLDGGQTLLAQSISRVTDDSWCSFSWRGNAFDILVVSLETFPSTQSSCVVRVDINYADQPTSYTNHTIENGTFLTIDNAPGITSIAVSFSSGSGLPPKANLSASILKNF